MTISVIITFFILAIIVFSILMLYIGLKYFTGPVVNGIESGYMYFRKNFFKVIKVKHYQNDPEGYVPLPFSDVLWDVKTKLKKFNKVLVLDCDYKGEVRTNKIFPKSVFDSNKNTLIFHHSAGDIDPQMTFNIVLGHEFCEKFNVFLIKAQKHGSSIEYFQEAADSFLHQQLTVAGSMLAVEEVVKFHRNNSKKLIYVSGTSMGGVISALHAFHFGTADKYFPLVAYPNVGEIFLSEIYKNGVFGWEEKSKDPAYLKNFEITPNMAEKVKGKIFPVIGEKDNIMGYERARDFWINLGFEVVSFPYGHLTPAVERDKIREFILSK